MRKLKQNEDYNFKKLLKKKAKEFVEDYNERPPKIFLSYSTEKSIYKYQEKWINSIKERIEQMGIHAIIFKDQAKKISNPKSAGAEIRECMIDCMGFICLFSITNKTVPVWPTFETGIAYRNNDKLICFLTMLDEDFIKEAKKDKGELNKLYELLVGLTIFIPFKVKKIDKNYIIKITNEIVERVYNGLDGHFNEIIPSKGK